MPIHGALISYFAQLNFTLGLYIYNKLRANSLFTLDADRSAHLLNYLLTNTQAESSSLLVPLRVFIELVKVDEKFADSFLGHSGTVVNNSNLDVYESLLAFVNGLLWQLLCLPVFFYLLHELYFLWLVYLVKIYLWWFWPLGLRAYLLVNNLYKDYNLPSFVCELKTIT